MLLGAVPPQMRATPLGRGWARRPLHAPVGSGRCTPAAVARLEPSCSGCALLEPGLQEDLRWHPHHPLCVGRGLVSPLHLPTCWAPACLTALLHACSAPVARPTSAGPPPPLPHRAWLCSAHSARPPSPLSILSILLHSTSSSNPTSCPWAPPVTPHPACPCHVPLRRAAINHDVPATHTTGAQVQVQRALSELGPAGAVQQGGAHGRAGKGARRGSGRPCRRCCRFCGFRCAATAGHSKLGRPNLGMRARWWRGSMGVHVGGRPAEVQGQEQGEGPQPCPGFSS